MKDLQFIKISSPDAVDIIPRKIFEGLMETGDTQDDVDRWILAAKMSVAHQMTFFSVILSEEQIVGILWIEYDMFSNSWFVQAISIDKEFQSIKKGEALRLAFDYWKSVPFGKEINKRIVFATTRPSSYEKSVLGAKRSKLVLMELNYE